MAMHKGKMKKKGMARGGAMKKKGMARGGMMKKKGMAKGGAKMPMRKDPKTGKMIPAFAMDGKGKMNKGGMTKKKKGMAKGGAAMKKKKGMAKGGATMKKKGYAAGGMTVGQLRAAAKAKGYKIMKG